MAMLKEWWEVYEEMVRIVRSREKNLCGGQCEYDHREEVVEWRVFDR